MGSSLVDMMDSVSRRKAMKGIFFFLDNGFIQCIQIVTNVVCCNLRVCLEAGWSKNPRGALMRFAFALIHGEKIRSCRVENLNAPCVVSSWHLLYLRTKGKA